MREPGLTRTGIVVALVREARCLASGGAQAGAGTCLRCSGIGPRRAAEAAGALIEAGAGALLSCGLAGGLDPALPPGSILIADTVLDEQGAAWPTDPAWRQSLAARLAQGYAGALVSVTAPVAQPSDKNRLRRARGARAVDMESAAVARVAAHHGVPFAALRVIADPAWAALPRAALCALDGTGRVRAGRLAAALLRRPADTLGLLRLARYNRRAEAGLRALARQLDDRWGPP